VKNLEGSRDHQNANNPVKYEIFEVLTRYPIELRVRVGHVDQSIGTALPGASEELFILLDRAVNDEFPTLKSEEALIAETTLEGFVVARPVVNAARETFTYGVTDHAIPTGGVMSVCVTPT